MNQFVITVAQKIALKILSRISTSCSHQNSIHKNEYVTEYMRLSPIMGSGTSTTCKKDPFHRLILLMMNTIFLLHVCNYATTQSIISLCGQKITEVKVIVLLYYYTFNYY